MNERGAQCFKSLKQLKALPQAQTSQATSSPLFHSLYRCTDLAEIIV